MKSFRTAVIRAALLLLTAANLSAAQYSNGTDPEDPRISLSPGLEDAGVAARGLVLIANRPRAATLSNPRDPTDYGRANTDLAFSGNLVFQGGYQGFQVWDVSNPAEPVLRKAVECPGGQGDVSVHRNLLFVSVEEPRARVDCGTQPLTAAVSAARFLGVRIFDVSDPDSPRQIAAVQTCRGSHTHTLVPDLRNPDVLYVYSSGAGRARPGSELEGCLASPTDPRTSYFRIDVIRVPLSRPQDARVVSSPAIFTDAASGALGGLWPGGAHGPDTQISSQTNHCHDITAYPERGIAAGACAGNGILLDIRDPAQPVRLDAVVDPNFAYWHSATLSNDASKIIFTDEWGGGSAPRCREADRREWGANAIFTLENGRLHPRSYYKLPVAQREQENCVAHNGSLIPVPGRDIKVQAWYQGGISVFDFTDPANPYEIAYFDRGPVYQEMMVMAGHWSAYWYNGRIYGSEILRGLDVLRLSPTPQLSRNEIAAAELVRQAEFNPQTQTRLEWPASFVVSRAYLDQLRRNGSIQRGWLTQVSSAIDRAERARGNARRNALNQLATRLERDARGSADPERVGALAESLRKLAAGD